VIQGTKFKVVKFEEKSVPNPKIPGAKIDRSELTLEDTESKRKVVLVIDETANSPDSIAAFKYLWDDTSFQKKPDETFALQPNEDPTYRLLTIGSDHVIIEDTETGQKTRLEKGLDKAPQL
jgi:hypothetical protein